MRQPKPFFRKYTRSWYVQLGGRQINLGRDEAAARQKYHELMLDRGQVQVTFTRVIDLLDAYLDWLQAHRSEATYDKCRPWGEKT